MQDQQLTESRAPAPETSGQTWFAIICIQVSMAESAVTKYIQFDLLFDLPLWMSWEEMCALRVKRMQG